MKGKLKMIILIIVVVIAIVLMAMYIIKNNAPKKEIAEYEPQEEISEEQERQTMVSLYFKNKTTQKVEPEARIVDVKEIVLNPYEKLINLLIEGPKKDNLEKTIPEGTKILSAKLEGETLILDFSEEFIENHKGGKEEEQATIDSLVDTLTELTEVNAIKILINGKENQSFKDEQINFEQNFIRNE